MKIQRGTDAVKIYLSKQFLGNGEGADGSVIFTLFGTRLCSRTYVGDIVCRRYTTYGLGLIILLSYVLHLMYEIYYLGKPAPSDL